MHGLGWDPKKHTLSISKDGMTREVHGNEDPNANVPIFDMHDTREGIFIDNFADLYTDSAISIVGDVNERLAVERSRTAEKAKEHWLQKKEKEDTGKGKGKAYERIKTAMKGRGKEKAEKDQAKVQPGDATPPGGTEQGGGAAESGMDVDSTHPQHPLEAASGANAPMSKSQLKRRMWCDVCQKRGHTTETCWWDEQAPATAQAQDVWPLQWQEEEEGEEEGTPLECKTLASEAQGKQEREGKRRRKRGKERQ
jgi:hypothetical protein